MVDTTTKFAFLGAGNMGSALLGGLLQTKTIAAENVVATVRSEETAAKLRDRFAIKATAGLNLEAAAGADIIILGAKPHIVPKVLDEIHEVLRPNQLLISLAAALPLAMLEKKAAKVMAIFRAMPNLPVIVLEGATAICQNGHTTAGPNNDGDTKS